MMPDVQLHSQACNFHLLSLIDGASWNKNFNITFFILFNLYLSWESCWDWDHCFFNRWGLHDHINKQQLHYIYIHIDYTTYTVHLYTHQLHYIYSICTYTLIKQYIQYIYIHQLHYIYSIFIYTSFTQYMKRKTQNMKS